MRFRNELSQTCILPGVASTILGSSTNILNWFDSLMTSFAMRKVTKRIVGFKTHLHRNIQAFQLVGYGEFVNWVQCVCGNKDEEECK